MVQEKLKIREEDFKEMKKQTEELLALEEKGLEDLKELEVHFKRWEKVAQRLKAGGDKIDSTPKEFLNKKNEVVFRLLTDLYDFLLRVLGIFDSAIKSIMKDFGRKDLYYTMQKRVLAHL